MSDRLISPKYAYMLTYYSGVHLSSVNSLKYFKNDTKCVQ